MKERIVNKMIDFYRGNRSDVRHFLKVYAYAQTIGRLEGLDEKTQDTLEIAAIVHDIACPLCREKYGNTNGNHQEAESEDLLRTFLSEFTLPEEMEERIIYLVTHHHTYTNVEGMDYQILLEADYLVNADESQYSHEAYVSSGNACLRQRAALICWNPFIHYKKYCFRSYFVSEACRKIHDRRRKDADYRSENPEFQVHQRHAYPGY